MSTASETPAVGPSDDELAAMAKADLHVHLVGSAAAQTVAALAARHPGSGVPADADQLAAFLLQGFRSLHRRLHRR
jgi:aminodeoxyfutalosine deaminase